MRAFFKAIVVGQTIQGFYRRLEGEWLMFSAVLEEKDSGGAWFGGIEADLTLLPAEGYEYSELVAGPLPAATATTSPLSSPVTSMKTRKRSTTLPRSKTRDEDESETDDDVEATDVDDEESCAAALRRWRRATANVPKAERAQAAWFTAEVGPTEFATFWASQTSRFRGLSSEGALASEVDYLTETMAHLHRALNAPSVSVATYAATKSMELLIEALAKCLLRAEYASAEALAEFELATAKAKKKCVRRPREYVAPLAIAAEALRKKGKRKRMGPRADGPRQQGGSGGTGQDHPTDTRGGRGGKRGGKF